MPVKPGRASVPATTRSDRLYQPLFEANVLKYLVEEVLKGQDEDVRAFLLQTSVLDRMNGALCDAVTEASTAPLVEVRDLTKSFGDFRAVDAVDFDISRGTITGLIGPNGAGAI